MQKLKGRSGHIAYSATALEISLIGGFGICDHYMCKKCFSEWDAGATYYPEDTYIEAKRASYYEAMIPMDEVN